MFSGTRAVGTDSTTETKVNTNYVTRFEHLQSFPHRLNFYDKPPLYDVTLEEFEISALNRLRILAEIESSGARQRGWDDLKTVTTTQCSKYLPLGINASIPDRNSSAKITELDAQRRSDVLGHFVLRLAFCRSEDLRRRFVAAETTLFKIRYETDEVKEREAFLNSRNFTWIPVPEHEKNTYKTELSSLYTGKMSADVMFNSDKYFKVPWTRVLDLVAKRKVFMKSGWAYVPTREQSSLVFNEFESALTLELEKTAKALPTLDEDNRLVPILDNLSQGFLAGVPSQWTSTAEDGEEGIKAEMVDDLAKKHWPACMRSLHSSFRRDHHLKHFGRLNYGLFLKGVGLSLDEAITFWRKGFEGRIDGDKFNKEYKYNIRHSYGQEGKRMNYPPKTCQQLIMGDPTQPGCPYRQASDDNLKTMLLNMYGQQGLSTPDLPEIMQMVKFDHYHVACTRVFEITHGRPKGQGIGDGESVTHPNKYAKLSIELEKEKEVGVVGEAMITD